MLTAISRPRFADWLTARWSHGRCGGLCRDGAVHRAGGAGGDARGGRESARRWRGLWGGSARPELTVGDTSQSRRTMAPTRVGVT